jgi:hypothetical protein
MIQYNIYIYIYITLKYPNIYFYIFIIIKRKLNPISVHHLQLENEGSQRSFLLLLFYSLPLNLRLHFHIKYFNTLLLGLSRSSSLLIHILSSFTRLITFFSLLNNQRDHTPSTIINNGGQFSHQSIFSFSFFSFPLP